jgi:acetyl esterase/lipase
MARLILTVFLFLLSLLCIFSAPMIQLWHLSVAVSEFSWVFMGLCVVQLLWGFKVKRYRNSGTILGVVTLLLFSSPIINACIISGSLNKRFEAAFGRDTRRAKRGSFSFWRMLVRINEPKVAYSTLAYTNCEQGPLTLDYYRSVISGKRPCVVVVHGGSWTSGGSQQLPELNEYLSSIGYNVATINYRLVPAYRSPAPVEDVHASLDYLRRHAEELSVDTNNFVLLGRSAGGQIVLVAAYLLHESGLKGVIDFYGPADMVWGYEHPANPLVLPSCKLMEDYLGGTLAQVPEKYKEASGTELVNASTVPTLMIHGQNDPLVAYDHSVRLDKKLQENGVKHLLLTLPWATHGCDFKLYGPSGQLSTYAIERFLNYVTGSSEKHT